MTQWGVEILLRVHVCHLSPVRSDHQSKHPQLSLHHVTDMTFVPGGSEWLGGLKWQYSTFHLWQTVTYFGRMVSFNTKESKRAVCHKYTVQQLLQVTLIRSQKVNQPDRFFFCVFVCQCNLLNMTFGPEHQMN